MNSNKQWCKSLLSIGEDNLRFCPIFVIGGGWTSTKTFFRWANEVKTKIKVFTRNETLFFPEFRWRPMKKKKVFTRNGTLFFLRVQVQTCAQMHTRVKLLEGMQMKTILKLLGGMQLNYWGGYIRPIPSGFWHPCTQSARQFFNIDIYTHLQNCIGEESHLQLC